MERHASHDGCLLVQRREYTKSHFLADVLVNTADSVKLYND